MYICICNAISEKQVTAALDNGAQNLHDLQNTLDVGSQCGSCREHCRNLVTQHHDAKQAKPPSPLALKQTISI